MNVYTFLTHCTTVAVPHNGVSHDVQYNDMLGYDSLLLRKNRWETLTNIFACLWKWCRSTVGYCM